MVEFGSLVEGSDGLLYELGEDKSLTEAIIELEEACMEVPHPLDQHMDEAIPFDEWVQNNLDKTQEDLALERGYDDLWFPQPQGPIERYVINPYDGHVMDMRHVIVVGYGMGQIAGLGAEAVQGVGALAGKDPKGSAFNTQDKYSNEIGAAFFSHDFQNHGPGGVLMDNFAERFQEFLQQAYGQNK